LDRRLDGPQSRSGHGGEEKNSQPPPGIEAPITRMNNKKNTEWKYTDLCTEICLSPLKHRNKEWKGKVKTKEGNRARRGGVAKEGKNNKEDEVKLDQYVLLTRPFQFIVS
jgi:hypothetical protein